MQAQRFLVAVFLVAAIAKPSYCDPFADELLRIQKLDGSRIGRLPILQAYQSLLDDYPEHPDRTKAMMGLASLWQWSDPLKGITPSLDQQIYWFGEAASSASPGTEDWFRAKYHLAGHLRHIDPYHTDLAKQICEEMELAAPDDVWRARAKLELVGIAGESGDLAEAEVLCRELLNWDINGRSMPQKTYDKGKVFECIQSAPHSYLYRVAEDRSATFAEREARIRAFTNEFGGWKVSEAGASALEYLHMLGGPATSPAVNPGEW